MHLSKNTLTFELLWTRQFLLLSGMPLPLTCLLLYCVFSSKLEAEDVGEVVRDIEGKVWTLQLTQQRYLQEQQARAENTPFPFFSARVLYRGKKWLHGILVVVYKLTAHISLI